MTWPHVSSDQAEKPRTSPHCLLMQNSQSLGEMQKGRGWQGVAGIFPDL